MQPYVKQYGGFSKSKHRTTIWFSNPTSEYYPKELKSASWRDICTSMFIAEAFTIAKTKSNLYVHQGINWLRKYGMHIMKDYSALKKKEEIPVFATTCMNL